MLRAACIATCFLTIANRSGSPLDVLALANSLGIYVAMPANAPSGMVRAYVARELARVAVGWAGTRGLGVDRDAVATFILAWSPSCVARRAAARSGPCLGKASAG